MERTYAQALFNLSQKPGVSSTELVKTLRAHLKETGREKLLPRILLESKRITARAESFSEVLEVAHKNEAGEAEKEAKLLGISAKAELNPDLITGWRARSGSRVIDRTGKRALLDLYRQIVAST